MRVCLLAVLNVRVCFLVVGRSVRGYQAPAELRVYLSVHIPVAAHAFLAP